LAERCTSFAGRMTLLADRCSLFAKRCTSVAGRTTLLAVR